MTWSTNESMSLLVKNPERLPDLVLNLSVLDLPRNQSKRSKKSKENGMIKNPWKAKSFFLFWSTWCKNLPRHKPDKLIETYWAIPVLIYLPNQLLRETKKFWCFSQTVPGGKKESKFMMDGVFLLLQPDERNLLEQSCKLFICTYKSDGMLHSISKFSF